MPAHLASIPGYAAAVKHENDVRDAAMLDLNARICGVEIRQVTLRDWIVLDGIDSPFLYSGVPDPAREHIERFLWILSPKYSRNHFLKWLFFRRVRRLPYGETVVKIRDFIKDTFQDSPPSCRDDKWTAPDVSFATTVVHSLSIRYGWTMDDILDTPIKVAFQFFKLARMSAEAEAGQTPVGWNPSDEIKMAHIRAVREARKTASLK